MRASATASLAYKTLTPAHVHVAYNTLSLHTVVYSIRAYLCVLAPALLLLSLPVALPSCLLFRLSCTGGQGSKGVISLYIWGGGVHVGHIWCELERMKGT